MRVTSPIDVELPPWAQVKKKRRAHIVRVTTLLLSWANAMKLSPEERQAWIDAGRFHDALRDAPVEELRALSGDASAEVELLHGPAAANRMIQDGEPRRDVLEAIRFHSIGCDRWDRVGRALYMADYLEPGRSFDVEQRAALAARVPASFDETFRAVVIARMAYATQRGFTLYPESVALLASVQ